MLSTDNLRSQLTEKQNQTIDLIIGGSNYSEASKQLGLCHNRVSKWKRDAIFKEVLVRASAEVSKEAIRIAAANSSKAVQKCVECLEAEDSTHFRSEEHTSELQSHSDLVCLLLLEKKKHTNFF